MAPKRPREHIKIPNYQKISRKNARFIALISKKITIFAVAFFPAAPPHGLTAYLTTLFVSSIVTEISKSTGIEKAVVLETVEKFMETVKDSLAHGNNVYLRGFGSFIIKTRSEKTARNISKNTTIIIPEHKIPAFKPAKVFMEEVK